MYRIGMHKITEWLRHVFIPHEGNQGEPHIFRNASVEALLFLSILGFALAASERVLVRETDMLASIYATALVDLANSERSSTALPELKINPLLAKAAELKAEDMATKGYFAHYSPEGLSPWHWMREAGYKYLYAGENLAIDFSDSVDVNRAWMNSPTHRANVLSGRYTEIGIAVRQGMYQGRTTTYVVQMFGSPKDPTPVASVTSDTSLMASVGPAFSFITTNPRYVMLSLYGAIAIMIIFGLIGLATVEWQKKHYLHVIMSILLLLVIAILSFIYSSGSTWPTILSYAS